MDANIKAIIFDFMGVLAFKSDDYVPDELVDGIDRKIGEVTDDEAFRQTILKDYNLSEEELSEVFKKIVHKYGQPNDELWQMLPGLRSRFKLAVINNGMALTFGEFKRKYSLENSLDLYVNSAIEGIRKPDPRIYLLACERLDVAPEEALYMDDHPANIEAARQLGMKTIHWQSREQGMKNFKEFLK